jgi:hypothetical protein
MFSKILRTGLFASLLLVVSMAFYGQSSPKQQLDIISSVVQSDLNDQYFDSSVAGSDESIDIADLDDDDDGSFSARKKISLEGPDRFFTTQHASHNFTNTAHSKLFCSTPFYQLPPSHFISLRVFRV